MHWLALQWPPDAVTGEGASAHWVGEAPSRESLAWWALAFTPHVVWLDEALLLEVSTCERLWGGRRALIQRVLQSNPVDVGVECARAGTSLVALARLRCQPLSGVLALDAMRGKASQPARPTRPVDLPLHTLTAARPHLPVLARLGGRTWGDVAALPRAGLSRRFGPELGRALDVAFGRAPDAHAWITPPDRFEQSLELPERADSAPALLWSARRLLQALQHWLAARQQGVLALELAWMFDQRRLDGRALPPEDAITLRTAEGVQTMAHIQRLLGERLARTPLLAPARAIRLRVLQTAAWNPATASFLPEDQPRGDALHVFVERVSARLGTDRVRVPVQQADHRPECRQRWQPAEQALPRGGEAAAPPRVVGERNQKAKPSLSKAVIKSAPSHPNALPSPAEAEPAIVGASSSINQGRNGKPDFQAEARARSLPNGLPDALSPTWLLREPQLLAVDGGQPCHQGQRLRLIAGPHRLETGWWGAAQPGAGEKAAARDYFIAQSATAELLWVYRERPMTSLATRAASSIAHTSARDEKPARRRGPSHEDRPVQDVPANERWFLQGLYA